MSIGAQGDDRMASGRFHDAVNSGDPEVISKTIDGVVEPDVVFHAPIPTGVPGAQAPKYRSYGWAPPWPGSARSSP